MPSAPIAIGLIVLGGLISLANGWTVLRRRRAGRTCSTVPLLGAALLGTGLYLLPATRSLCWAALVLDYGTFDLLLASPRVLREFLSTSRFNLVDEYQGQAGARSVHLRLFRRSVFTLRLHVKRPPGECGVVDAGTIGIWQREGARLTLCADDGEAVFEVLGTTPAESLRQTVGFPAWAKSPERALADIELHQVAGRPDQSH